MTNVDPVSLVSHIHIQRLTSCRPITCRLSNLLAILLRGLTPSDDACLHCRVLVYVATTSKFQSIHVSEASANSAKELNRASQTQSPDLVIYMMGYASS